MNEIKKSLVNQKNSEMQMLEDFDSDTAADNLF